MDDKELRSRNRRVGWSVIAGMLALAGLTALYAWSTIGYRRDVDTVQPDSRSMKRDALNVAGLTIIAVGAGFVIYRWRANKEPRTK